MSTYSGNNTQSNKLIVLNSRHLDESKNPIPPHFTKSEKGEDGLWSEIGQCTGFKARLVKVSPETKEYKSKDGKTVDTKEMVKLLFASEDSEESYLLSLTYRMASRDLFNSILNLETFDGLDVSAFRNKKGYEKFSLKQNGEYVPGKYTYEEFKAKIKMVEIRKKLESDPTDLNDMLKLELKGVNDKIAKANSGASPAATSKVEVEEDDESSIPF